LPLTPETRHFADQAFIARCKPGFVLINTSRGHCIKTEDLADGLETGKIVGACLDVYENEKTATFSPAEKALYQRLYQLDQVVLSPHIAGWTHESKRRLAEVLLEKIKKAV
jgi:D-3-phosphoglycerate dehydrogenase